MCSLQAADMWSRMECKEKRTVNNNYKINPSWPVGMLAVGALMPSRSCGSRGCLRRSESAEREDSYREVIEKITNT